MTPRIRALGSRLLAVGASMLLSSCEIRFGYDDASSCGNCVLENAQSACREGVCVVEFCLGGYDDCDGNPSNGCETSLRSAWRHCGVCNNACTNDVGCVDGACAPRTAIAETGTDRPVVLALDANYVYFAPEGQPSAVFSTPKIGGETRQLSTATGVGALAVDDEYVYWLEVPEVAPFEPVQTRLQRSPKTPDGEAAPVTLAAVGGYLPAMVVQQQFVYVSATTSSGAVMARVHRSGSPGLERLPGWKGAGSIFGLQARGDRVVFAFTDSQTSHPSVIEYTPGDGTFHTLHENLSSFAFAVDASALYYEDRYGSSDPNGTLMNQLSLESGSVQSVAVRRMDYRSMVADRGSLFLLDEFRGNLLEIDYATREGAVVFGAQKNVGNVAIDQDHVYFVDGRQLLRMAR